MRRKRAKVLGADAKTVVAELTDWPALEKRSPAFKACSW
jgi:hypothetical protein